MKTIELVIIVTVITLVILIAVYCERKKKLRRVIQYEESSDCDDDLPCATCNYTCRPIPPPVLADIPTFMMVFDEGGNENFIPPIPGGPNTWTWTVIGPETFFIPAVCNTARPSPYALPNLIAGTAELSPTNSNPLGGYIMSAPTDQKDYTLPYTQVLMSTAMTQAQLTSGEYFIFGFPVDNSVCPSATYPINVFAVSQWVDLGATFTIVGDTLHVAWPAFDVSACSIGPWEIIVTARDTVIVCSFQGAAGNYANMNLGGTVPITATSLVIQLSSGPGGLAHSITQCAAYAYPVCNKSAPTTFYVNSIAYC